MNEKILVVDDIDNIAFIIKTILSREGYDAITAHSYNEARKELDKTDFDLVFTDVELGDNRTGVDILKVVKETNPICPVVLFTGYPNIESESEAFRLGAYDYIPKPVTKDKLLHIVNMILHN